MSCVRALTDYCVLQRSHASGVHEHAARCGQPTQLQRVLPGDCHGQPRVRERVHHTTHWLPTQHPPFSQSLAYARAHAFAILTRALAHFYSPTFTPPSPSAHLRFSHDSRTILTHSHVPTLFNMQVHLERECCDFSRSVDGSRTGLPHRGILWHCAGGRANGHGGVQPQRPFAGTGDSTRPREQHHVGGIRVVPAATGSCRFSGHQQCHRRHHCCQRSSPRLRNSKGSSVPRPRNRPQHWSHVRRAALHSDSECRGAAHECRYYACFASGYRRPARWQQLCCQPLDCRRRCQRNLGRWSIHVRDPMRLCCHSIDSTWMDVSSSWPSVHCSWPSVLSSCP
jgi:hypothetical protein